jgi:O-antigen/teichoic acid export membrane protein
VSTSLTHSTLHSAVAGLSVVLGGFLSNVIVARALGVEAAGVVAFATWAITVGVMLGDLGAPGSLARYLPDLRARGLQDDGRGLVRWLFGLEAIAAGIVFFGFLAYAGWCWLSNPSAGLRNEHFRSDPLFWILVASACLTQIAAAFATGYFRGMQRFATIAKLAAISAAIQIGVTFAGAMMFGAVGALAGPIAGSVLLACQLPRLLAPAGAVPVELRRRVLRFALESWAGYLVTAFAWARMEIFFLELSWGSQSVALFAASLTLANLATQGPLLLTGGLLPHLAQQSAAGSGPRPQDTYAISVRILAFLIFPACLGTAAIAPSLVPAIYGREFAGAVPSAVILLCGAAITASSSVAFTYLLAMERTRFVFLTGGVAALLVIAAGMSLIPLFGTIAAAMARALIQACVAIATVWYLNRHLACPTPVGSLIRLFAAAAVCALAAFGVIEMIPGAVGIPFAVLAGAVVYGTAVRILKALPQSDIRRLLNAIAILPWPIRIPAATTLRLIAA